MLECTMVRDGSDSSRSGSTVGSYTHSPSTWPYPLNTKMLWPSKRSSLAARLCRRRRRQRWW